MIDPHFWKGRKVFLTGHTGFKGSWLCLWLHRLGAEVTGYALEPPTDPSLFEIAGVDRFVHSIFGDVRDQGCLVKSMVEAEPEIAIHMAAQPLVRASYQETVDTYMINVMGTVHFLEAMRQSSSIRAAINVTTDKCYQNQEWLWAYREYEPLGGYDPYSSSKACSEIVTDSYRSSFFNPNDYGKKHRVALASSRAGNVIGGGDWAEDRLIPDCLRAIMEGNKIVLRNPNAIRPWQQVLEPLSGYLLLAQKLLKGGSEFAEAWNFGPSEGDERSVAWVVEMLHRKLRLKSNYEIGSSNSLHEATYLKLDCSKAKTKLGWRNRWNVETAIEKVADWFEAYRSGEDMSVFCFNEIEAYEQQST